MRRLVWWQSVKSKPLGTVKPRCVDCKHSRYDAWVEQRWCSHESVRGEDAAGDAMYPPECASARLYRCGAEAVYFEPKEATQ